MYLDLTTTPEYGVWQAMKNRCRNPKLDSYKNYGAKGIKVCQEWQQSFTSFLKDMGFRPSSKHSIDRIDNTGDYAPDNCRWATSTVQNLNKGKMKTNTSGYIGVSACSSKWRAYTSIAGRVVHLGLFITPEEAAYVRDQFVSQLYGECVVLNF